MKSVIKITSKFCCPLLLMLHLVQGSIYKENPFYSNSWALIIGINNYEHDQKLHYSVADAEILKKLLIEKLDFPEDNVFMLLDEEASLINIRKKLSKLSEVTANDDRVLIYFAGHGVTDPLPNGGEEGYLIPVDGDKKDLFTTALPMSEMERISARVPAKDMLFLIDACYSGLMGIGNRGIVIDKKAPNYLKKIAAGGSRTIITAGKKGEIAQERPEWGHSAFVKSLISGLDKAMADDNGDLYITESELGEHLQEQVTIDTDNAQTPIISHFTSDQGQFVFILGDINLTVENPNPATYGQFSDSSKFGTVNATDSSFVDAILAELRKRGIKSEEIAKNSSDIGNSIKNDLGLTKGKIIANCSFAKSPTQHFADISSDDEGEIIVNDISNDNWLRYNRSEGLYYQINRVFQSPNIPGSSFYGGLGRSFHRKQFQWIFGLEQLVWKNNIQFYIEGFDKSITPDAWRVWDGENSLSTMFRRQDYLDWYNALGFRVAGFIHIKNYISIGAEYNQFTQTEMDNVLEGDKFKDNYQIEKGDNAYLKSILSIGYPIELSVRDKWQMYTILTRINSGDNSDFNYTNDHLYFNILIPYAEKLNFNIKVLVGASNVAKSIWHTQGYHQNIFKIGGKGTLRGYDWKELATSHYQLTTLELWFGFVGVFYDRAVKFESSGNVFNTEYFSDLFENISNDVYDSMGFSFGRKKFRLSFAQKLKDTQGSVMYLTFGTPLQYW